MEIILFINIEMKVLLLILLTLFSSISYSQSIEDLVYDTAPVEDDPDDFIKFCRTLDRIAPFAQEYKVIPWFNVGAPGMVLAQFQNSSPMFEICNYYIGLKKNDLRSNILATANLLTKTTDTNFNEMADLMFSYHDTADSIYDLESGEFRRGALTNASNHRRIINLADKTKRYFSEDNKGIETQADRRIKLQEISQLAYEQAVLDEGLKCPKPRMNESLKQLYTEEIVPLEEEIREHRVEIRYYKRMLLRMGEDLFMSSSGESIKNYKKYVNDINFILSGYSRFIEREVSETRVTNRNTTELDKEGKPIWKDVTYADKYNFFTAREDISLFSPLLQKYTNLWDSFVSSKANMSSKGYLLGNKEDRIEAKYRQSFFECSEIRLRKIDVQLRNLDERDPSYQTFLRKATDKCIKGLEFRDAEFKNLMQNYMTQLAKSVHSKNSKNAKIWNFEGKYMGINRAVVSDSSADNFQKNEIFCSEQLETAEIRAVAIRSKSLNTKIRQEIMEGQVKSNILADEKEKALSKDKEEIEAKEKIMDDLREERSRSKKYSAPILRPTGAI